MKMIFLNGPPGCGKDTAADMIAEHLSTSARFVSRKGFARILKKATHASLGLSRLPWNAFDFVAKDRPNADFFGSTPREAYIAHSEVYMKKVYGNNVFARLLERDINYTIKICGQKADNTIVIISDCGFVEEYNHFKAQLGVENLLLFRLYRPGHTFAFDSRSYIETGNQIDVINKGTLNELEETVVACVKTWLTT